MSREDGTVEPFTADGHTARVEAERERVVCDECPWFRWMPGATKGDMRKATYAHRDGTRIR